MATIVLVCGQVYASLQHAWCVRCMVSAGRHMACMVLAYQAFASDNVHITQTATYMVVIS